MPRLYVELPLACGLQAALPPGLDRDRSAKAASLIEASLPQEEIDAARASAKSWEQSN